MADPLTTTSAEALMHRADLLYCLARAFLPPPAGWSICDWGQALVDDLQELGVALELDAGPACSAIAAECERWVQAARTGDGQADDWLVEYARLFLTPPIQVTLNTGVYLEGSLGGSSQQMMQACYQVAGLAPDEDFHDLPDHVAMQMEFVARLLERAARGEADASAMADEYAGEFIHAWAGPLCEACRQAAVRVPAAKVFLALAELLRQVVRDPSPA